MRLAVSIILSLLATPALLLSAGDVPTTAPDSASHVSRWVGGLFDLPYSQQQRMRQELEKEADLPMVLSRLLHHADPAVRRTSLMLLRDDYGDWPVVAAVQWVLSAEMSRPNGGDGYVIAACCDVLADWPRWDSIPVLLDAMKTDCRVARQRLRTSPRQPDRVAVWREVDAALRLVSGEWPIPEPDAPGDRAVRPGSPRDRSQQEELQKAWGEWWVTTSLMADPLPQVRLEVNGIMSPPRSPAAGDGVEHGVVARRLWIRPTGSVRYSRLVGTAGTLDEPIWRWDDRSRRNHEFHLNALQADAVRALTSVVIGVGVDAAAAAPLGTWAIARPPGAPENWRGRLQITTVDGQTASVELADVTVPGAVRPPAPAAEALAELLTLTAVP